MGWKSSLCLTKAEAAQAIRQCQPDDLESLSIKELEDIMYNLDIGDDTNKPYYGYNFRIVDTQEEKDKWNNS